MPSSVTSVSRVNGKLGLAPVLHTLNTGDLVLRDQHQYLLQHCIVRLGVSCHKSVKIVDMSDERTDQSMRTTLFLLILVMCVLILLSLAW